MKHGKNPTVAQKKKIASYNLNSSEWLVVKDCPIIFQIKNRYTGESKIYNMVS